MWTGDAVDVGMVQERLFACCRRECSSVQQGMFDFYFREVQSSENA